MKTRIIFFTSLVLLFGWSVNAQENVGIDTYEELKKEVDYSKTKEIWEFKEFPADQKKHKKTPKDNINTNWIAGISGVFMVLGYLLLAIIIIGIIYVVVKDINTDKFTKTEHIDLDNLEDIEAVDFELLLLQALESNDYRRAFRVRFLMAIKSLTQNKHLVWKPYKTNRAYVNELSNSPYQTEFRRLANVFEFVWYGVSSINESDYNRYINSSSDFFNNIGNE